MKHTSRIFGAAAAVMVLGAASVASAQPPEQSYWAGSERAPADAFELTLGSGFTSGFGDFQSNPNNDIRNIARSGVSFDVGVGYRISPELMLGVAGGHQWYQRGDEFESPALARGATGRLEGTYHFAPYVRTDPWVKLGTGYRMLYITDQPEALSSTQLHGLEIANLSVGLDVRASEDVAIAPLIGADLSMFLWDREGDAIDAPRLTTFVYAGLLARLDFGGDRVAPRRRVYARR